MTVLLGDGCSSRLWTDSWARVGPLHQFVPDLFAAISRTGRKRTVKDGLFQNQWARDIVGALTTQVLFGGFVWNWSVDGKYSTSITYRAFFAGSTPPRVKFFFWLALHRRLWTAERRMRHGLQDVAGCALCGQAPETGEHLFLGCVFVRQLWFHLLAPLA